MYIIDFDDFCEDNHRLPLLDQLKEKLPDFRATLFTIPGRCSSRWLREIQESRPWFDLVPHGWMHPHSRECQDWTFARMTGYLQAIKDMGLTRGWKAPGWQISNDSYDVLLREGYWLADQPYNRARRPNGLRYYELDAAVPHFHGHIGHLGGHNDNEIEYLMPELLKLGREDFGFVRDHLKVWDSNAQEGKLHG